MAVKVKLNREGREYLHYPVSGLPIDLTLNEVFEFRASEETLWFSMEWVILADPVNNVWSVWDGVTGTPTHARILLAGPDGGFTTGVILPLGTTLAELRFLSDPEVVIRDSPVVIIVS